MPAPTNFEARGAILAHHQNGQSHRKIIDALFDLGFSVSTSTVTRVITEFEREKRGILNPAKKLGPQCLPYKRTKDLIRKVDAATNVDNPSTLDQMAERRSTPTDALLCPTGCVSQSHRQTLSQVKFIIRALRRKSGLIFAAMQLAIDSAKLRKRSWFRSAMQPWANIMEQNWAEDAA
ncbi:hypothetical protein BV898_06414 [Hypsibius exemplaris]|uniref:Uncharacterized protein n=1 Tax=Hypsibius exemplaris TaxID=2072580 RepID=A0A1W0WWT9_HYPEX|nr:hypothetical protein BV898_06414 [Hypsibius exemplaris]